MIVIVVVLHIFYQTLAYLYPDNRVLADLAERFGLDAELSVPTWLTAIMAFGMAGLAWLIGMVQTDKIVRRGWYLIAAVGVFVSVDEVSSLHELLLQSLHILAGFGAQTFFDNAWLIILPFLAVGAIVAFRYLKRSLPADTFRLLVQASIVYLLGAFVVEYLSIPMDKSLLVYTNGAVVIEETLEFIGLVLVIRALCHHVVVHETKLHRNIKELAVS